MIHGSMSELVGGTPLVELNRLGAGVSAPAGLGVGVSEFVARAWEKDWLLSYNAGCLRTFGHPSQVHIIEDTSRVGHPGEETFTQVARGWDFDRGCILPPQASCTSTRFCQC